MATTLSPSLTAPSTTATGFTPSAPGWRYPRLSSPERRVELWVYDDDGRASGGGSSGKCKSDVNSDKIVNIEDLLSLLGEYGKKC
eukprot:COSAG05_NODE_957_length_6426_cov_16.557768_1_plen_85_part_00